MLIQVVINLLSNSFDALQYSKEKNITISSEVIRNRKVLSIKDTGCGIEEENIQHVFDIFYSNKVWGSGLGLFFSKIILEKMDMEILWLNCVSSG